MEIGEALRVERSAYMSTTKSASYGHFHKDLQKGIPYPRTFLALNHLMLGNQGTGHGKAF